MTQLGENRSKLYVWIQIQILRMEEPEWPEVTLQEQEFHNAIREHIISLLFYAE